MGKPFVRKLRSGAVWVVKVKLLDGSWYQYNTGIAVEFDGDGDPTARSMKKAEVARDRLQAAESRGEKPFGTESVGESGKLNLRAVIASFIESRGSRWDSGTAGNRRVNAKDALSFFGNVSVVKISNDAIDKYIRHLSSKYAPATVNSKLTDLYALLNHASKRLKIGGVEYERVFVTEPDEVGDYLDANELARVLANCTSKTVNGESIRDFVAFLAYSGMRRGEALQAKWSWIRGDEILIPGFEKQDGKQIRITKNGKPRRVPLWSGLREIVERCPKDGLLFPRMSEASGRRFRQAVREAGIDRSVHLHSLRDTFVHLASGSGIPIEVVRAIVGNDIKVLLRHYAGVRSSDMLAAVERGFGATLVR